MSELVALSRKNAGLGQFFRSPLRIVSIFLI